MNKYLCFKITQTKKLVPITTFNEIKNALIKSGFL